MTCPFMLLGVDHDADERAARKAHRTLMLGGAHPDKGGTLAHAQALGEAVSLIAEGRGFRRCDCRSARTARPGERPRYRPEPSRTPEEDELEELLAKLRRAAAARARADAEARAREERARQAPPTWDRPSAADPTYRGPYTRGGQPIYEPGAARPPQDVRDLFGGKAKAKEGPKVETPEFLRDLFGQK